MTDDAAGRASRNVTLQNVQVGAAYRGHGDFHDRITRRFDLRNGPLLQGLPARPLVDESFHHRSHAATDVGADCANRWSLRFDVGQGADQIVNYRDRIAWSEESAMNAIPFEGLPSHRTGAGGAARQYGEFGSRQMMAEFRLRLPLRLGAATRQHNQGATDIGAHYHSRWPTCRSRHPQYAAPFHP